MESSIQKFENKLMPQLGMTMKLLQDFMEVYIEQNNIEVTRAQWVILTMLGEEDGISQFELACSANRDKASITRLISNMEKKNLVARIPDKEDKRVNKIYITTYGKEVLEKQFPVLSKVANAIEEGLSSDELDFLKNCLVKIRSNVHEMREKYLTK